MLQNSAVTSDTLELLKHLQSMPELTDTRLAGGTALAFHLGHRLSIDLDLFGTFDNEMITEILKAEEFDDFYLSFESKIIKRYIINKVKIDLVKYDRYQWLEEVVIKDKIRLAGLKDIAAMKVAAITNRGSKKDFIDLFFLLQIFDIQKIIEFYQTKYFDANLYCTVISLGYFDDAEKDEMPQMLIPTTWNDVKKRIMEAVKRI